MLSMNAESKSLLEVLQMVSGVEMWFTGLIRRSKPQIQYEIVFDPRLLLLV